MTARCSAAPAGAPSRASTKGPWSPNARILAADASTIYVGSPSSTVQHAFAAKLGADGSVLWSTLLAGSRTDEARAIAADGAGNAYVAGSTTSIDFPGGAALGRSDAFVARISSDGTRLLYSALLGGEGDDAANAIAVDPSGIVYVAGRDGTGRGSSFVAQLGPAGERLTSTILGGVNGWPFEDAAHAIALGGGGVWVAGRTGAMEFPLVQPLQPSLGPGVGSYVTHLVIASGRFVPMFSTYLGWTGDGLFDLAPTGGGAWVSGAEFFGRVDLLPSSNTGLEIRAVYNAASYRLGDMIAPGEIVTLFGSGFDGATVTVGGTAAKLYYVGPTQINFVAPSDLPPAGVSIVVRRGDQTAERPVTVGYANPGIFVVVHASDYSPVTRMAPARRGEYLAIFCTGIGPTQAGVVLDSRFTQPAYAGPAPGYPGLSQINFQVPANEPSGAELLYVSAGDNSNQVWLYVE